MSFRLIVSLISLIENWNHKREKGDGERTSKRQSRILRPLVFRTQRLLLFERSYNTRTQSTAHAYPNAIKNNRMQYYGLQINYPINICVPCIMHVPKKLIVTDGRDIITDWTRKIVCDIADVIQIAIFLSVQPIIV